MERLPDGSYIIGGKDVAITGLDVNSGDVSIIVCIFNLIDLGLFFFVWMKHEIPGCSSANLASWTDIVFSKFVLHKVS